MKTAIKTLALAAGLTLAPLAADAQKTATSVLSTMPQELIPYINDDQRGEMSKFSIENDTVTIKNELNGTSTVTVINDDFAKIDLSKSAMILIKLLPVSDTAKIICMVRTIKTPLPESDIRFYNTDWSPIKSKFNLPDLRNDDEMLAMLTQRPDSMTEAKFEELRSYIEPVIVSADIPDGGYKITLNLNIPFTTKEERKNIKAIIRQKSFKWNGKTFKMI